MKMLPWVVKIFLVFFICLQTLKAQKTFHVMVQKPASLANKNFIITYDDGLKISTVTDTFINNKLNFSGKYFSRFAVLKISFINNSTVYYDEYFIGKLPVQIIFRSDTDFLVDCNFHHDKLINAFEIYQSKIKKQRNEFLKEEINEMNQFCASNGNSIWKVDSLKKLFYKNLHNINEKDIDFIKQNSNEYFSFWMFRTQVIPITFQNEHASVLDFKNLLNLYNTEFPQMFKKSAEGKKIEELLSGRIATQKHHPVPDFEIKDILGNAIKLSQYKGKYVLLDFWATWCAPCMAQLPFIKKIRADYHQDKLIMISITADVDYKKFESVIRENSMDWIHVFGNSDFSKSYGVNTIPATFLIDKEGVLIFDGKESNIDELITLLKNKL